MDTGIHDIRVAGEKTPGGELRIKNYELRIKNGLLDKILEFADEYCMFPDSGSVLACVSGGADSMSLLEALLEISQKRGFAVIAVHYDHMLRGDESRRDEVFVRDRCEARGIPFYSGSGDVRARAAQRGLGIEEAAREMRYGFFYATAGKTGASRIATAHTADDNAETIMINLARGAGAAGLSGIPPKRGMLIRPMLRVSREDVMRFTADRGIPFVEDSTNSLDIYTRNKVRHAIIPVIREINPRFNEAAATTAALLRADDEYLSELADGFIAKHCEGSSADAGELLELPFAVSSRVVRRLYGGKLSFGHVKAVLELCGRNDPSACLALPGMAVYREYGRVIFGKEDRKAAESFDPLYPEDGLCMEIPGLGLKISCISMVCSDKINKSFTSFLFKNADICGKMTVRPRREGDFIRLNGSGGTKTLKKLFIERRIPMRKRALVPVIADDAGVLAVYGLGAGDRAIPNPGDPAIQIDLIAI